MPDSPVMHDTELVLDARAELGEAPLWDPRSQSLLWVDIDGRRLHRLHPESGRTQTVEMADRPGCIALDSAGRIVVALGGIICRLDVESPTSPVVTLVDPELRDGEGRFNDGKCDPAGRFWVGTIASDWSKPGCCALYCMASDFSLRRVVDGVTCSNGMAWSLDSRTMYYIDSVSRRVVAYDYNVDTGHISNCRVALDMESEQGVPDGMTIDREGMLWVAMFGGGGVGNWDPATGRRLGRVRLPVSQVTSCAFGGPDLTDLYITTARSHIAPDALHQQPLAGGLFRARPGVGGMQPFVFGGAR